MMNIPNHDAESNYNEGSECHPKFDTAKTSPLPWVYKLPSYWP